MDSCISADIIKASVVKEKSEGWRKGKDGALHLSIYLQGLYDQRDLMAEVAVKPSESQEGRERENKAFVSFYYSYPLIGHI